MRFVELLGLLGLLGLLEFIGFIEFVGLQVTGCGLLCLREKGYLLSAYAEDHGCVPKPTSACKHGLWPWTPSAIAYGVGR